MNKGAWRSNVRVPRRSRSAAMQQRGWRAGSALARCCSSRSPTARLPGRAGEFYEIEIVEHLRPAVCYSSRSALFLRVATR